jgi:phage FluMu protein Com
MAQNINFLKCNKIIIPLSNVTHFEQKGRHIDFFVGKNKSTVYFKSSDIAKKALEKILASGKTLDMTKE